MTAADQGSRPGEPMTTADQEPMTAADLPAPSPQPNRPASSSRPAWSSRPARALALLAAAQLLAGLLAGVVWRLTSPSAVSYLLSGADGKPPFVVPDESESQIAGDGRFVLLSIALGMVFGLVAWRLRVQRGPIVLGTLAVAGLLSSLLARGVGELLSTGSADRQLDAAFTPQLSLHALPALAVQAFFAVLVYTARAGLSADPDLGDG